MLATTLGLTIDECENGWDRTASTKCHKRENKNS